MVKHAYNPYDCRDPAGGSDQERVITSQVPTIGDVARVAQVDKSTVSRALNRTGRVSDETRQRVVEVAQRLGYRPSRLAKGFRSGSSTTVGILTGSLNENGTADFISGVLDVTEVAGYSVILGEAGIEAPSALRSLDFPIDAAIILAGSHPEHRRIVRNRGLPVADARMCVHADPHSPAEEYPVALEAYRTLVQLGHVHIATVELNTDVEDGRHQVRHEALGDALEDSPLEAIGEAREHPYRVANSAEAYQVVCTLLADRLVTAISVGSDSLLPGVLSAFAESNVTIGADVSLLSVSHSTMTAALHPTLSVLAHDQRGDGQRAAYRLLQELGVSIPEEFVPSTANHWQFEHRASVVVSPVILNC